MTFCQPRLGNSGFEGTATVCACLLLRKGWWASRCSMACSRTGVGRTPRSCRKQSAISFCFLSHAWSSLRVPFAWPSVAGKGGGPSKPPQGTGDAAVRPVAPKRAVPSRQPGPVMQSRRAPSEQALHGCSGRDKGKNKQLDCLWKLALRSSFCAVPSHLLLDEGIAWLLGIVKSP